jgi:hypothetical protein
LFLWGQTENKLSNKIKKLWNFRAFFNAVLNLYYL